jgi:hypothetical protein
MPRTWKLVLTASARCRTTRSSVFPADRLQFGRPRQARDDGQCSRDERCVGQLCARRSQQVFRRKSAGDRWYCHIETGAGERHDLAKANKTDKAGAGQPNSERQRPNCAQQLRSKLGRIGGAIQNRLILVFFSTNRPPDRTAPGLLLDRGLRGFTHPLDKKGDTIVVGKE